MIYLVTNQTELIERSPKSGIHLSSVDDSLKFLSGLNVISCDTETTGFIEHNCEVLSLQLGNREHQYVIDTQSVDIKKYKKLLESTDKTFIWQNYLFDARFMFKNGIIQDMDCIYDTFIAEAVLTRGYPAGQISLALDALAKRYCRAYLDKTVRGNIHREGLSDRVIRYAADDVKYLEDIKDGQYSKLQKYDLLEYLRLENKFSTVLAYTMHCGFYLDQSAWEEKSNQDRQDMIFKMDQLNNAIHEMYPESKYVDNQGDLFSGAKKTHINWDSPKDVAEFMEFLGFNITIEDQGKSKKSVDKKVIAKYREHPIVNMYIEYSELAKLCSTYGHSFLKTVIPKTNRVHTVYRQILNTGRISSGKTNRKRNEVFPNLQNIPSDERHRHCFVPEKGNKLIVGDYSGQEQVVLANASREPGLIDFYKKDLGDMHKLTVHVKLDEFRETPIYRTILSQACSLKAT